MRDPGNEVDFESIRTFFALLEKLPHLEWKCVVIELPDTFLLLIWLPSFESFSARWIWISVHLIYGDPRDLFVYIFATLKYIWLSLVQLLVYGTPGDRAKLLLNLHNWKRIYLKIIVFYLSSLLWTTFRFLSLRCNISSGGEKIIRFPLFEFVLRVFFAEDFGIRIDEILLKRHFFNMLLLFLRDVLEIAVNKLTFYKRLM